MSYAPEVTTARTPINGVPIWTGNALRFATYDEADRYVRDLALRWTAVYDIRVVESSDPVNYAIIDNELVRVLNLQA